MTSERERKSVYKRERIRGDSLNSFFVSLRIIMSTTNVTTITGITVEDVRFPTSKDFSGSDAMTPDP